ncbi:hypothetical protein [Nocardioides jishulii]|uniref:Uncharacterized protein n=1 Tax=Nocardioides jishulii TaxID=2575440 RepID=A0A4U2YS59_9ACTN|nr:hypothetical protein [Nocardioides jishulii]QCX28816.1 hypothetical protein FCL41_15725 [Nocardioides jishulii]TKI64287.1 hypothetical protein FC770_03840 [Nocardioides jishulii]
MTDDDLLALLDATLGETLTPAGFSAAQGGWDGVTFFAPQRAFGEQFPWLPQASPEEWQRGHSTDLTIDFDQTTGLIARIDLEGRSLPSTVYAVGAGALSAELKTAYARPLAECLPVVAEALETIFREPDPAPAEPEPAEEPYDGGPVDDYA